MQQAFNLAYDARQRKEKLIREADKIYYRLCMLKESTTLSHQQKSIIKKELKRRLKKVEKSLDFYHEMLIETSTFNNDIIVPFLAFYLSCVENEPYVAIKDIEDNTVITTVSNVVKEGRVNSKRTYSPYNGNLAKKTRNSKLRQFSAAMDTIEQISFTGSVDNVQAFVRNYKDRKYIILSGETSCSLLEGLDYDYTVYPYLSRMINDLINMKLEDQHIGDMERLSVISQQIIEQVQIRR